MGRDRARRPRAGLPRRLIPARFPLSLAAHQSGYPVLCSRREAAHLRRPGQVPWLASISFHGSSLRASNLGVCLLPPLEQKEKHREQREGRLLAGVSPDTLGLKDDEEIIMTSEQKGDSVSLPPTPPLRYSLFPNV